MKKKKSLKKLRGEIDKLDIKIVTSLNKRADFALQIGKIKMRRKERAYVPDREAQVYKKLRNSSKGPLSDETIAAIYREIMSGTRALEKKLKIAYLGPATTFSHRAALEKFGSQAEYVSCYTITDVFREVEREKSDYGPNTERC